MSYAIRVHAFGGPEVMKWEEVQLDGPGPGQVKIKQYAAGVKLSRRLSPHRALPDCRNAVHTGQRRRGPGRGRR